MNEANNSKFITGKWNIINDNLKPNYDAANEITYNTETLKFNFCDCHDAYILVRGDITVVANLATQRAFKNYAPSQKFMKQQ